MKICKIISYFLLLCSSLFVVYYINGSMLHLLMHHDDVAVLEAYSAALETAGSQSFKSRVVSFLVRLTRRLDE